MGINQEPCWERGCLARRALSTGSVKETFGRSDYEALRAGTPALPVIRLLKTLTASFRSCPFLPAPAYCILSPSALQ